MDFGENGEHSSGHMGKKHGRNSPTKGFTKGEKNWKFVWENQGTVVRCFGGGGVGGGSYQRNHVTISRILLHRRGLDPAGVKPTAGKNDEAGKF